MLIKNLFGMHRLTWYEAADDILVAFIIYCDQQIELEILCQGAEKVCVPEHRWIYKMTESPCSTWSSSKIDRNNGNEEIGPERVINGIPPRSASVHVGSQKKKKKEKKSKKKEHHRRRKDSRSLNLGSPLCVSHLMHER